MFPLTGFNKYLYNGKSEMNVSINDGSEKAWKTLRLSVRWIVVYPAAYCFEPEFVIENTEASNRRHTNTFYFYKLFHYWILSSSDKVAWVNNLKELLAALSLSVAARGF